MLLDREPVYIADVEKNVRFPRCFQAKAIIFARETVHGCFLKGEENACPWIGGLHDLNVEGYLISKLSCSQIRNGGNGRMTIESSTQLPADAISGIIIEAAAIKSPNCNLQTK